MMDPVDELLALPMPALDGGAQAEGPVCQVNSAEELALIESIADEAGALFPVGKVFGSLQELREQVQSFGRKKGFVASTKASGLCCSRCDESSSMSGLRKKRAAMIPEEKKRSRSTTRVGCQFKIGFKKVDWKDKSKDAPVVISQHTNYKHTNGCAPSRSMLAVEKRKVGTFTSAVNECQIKSILVAMSTGSRVPTALLRELIRPLFPDGTAHD